MERYLEGKAVFSPELTGYHQTQMQYFQNFLILKIKSLDGVLKNREGKIHQGVNGRTVIHFLRGSLLIKSLYHGIQEPKT